MADSLSDDEQLVQELNSCLEAFGESVTNLEAELQDASILLTLIEFHGLGSVKSYHKRTAGVTLSPSQVSDNVRKLCSLLNKHRKKHGHLVEFTEQNVLSRNTPMTVKYILQLLQESDQGSSSGSTKSKNKSLLRSGFMKIKTALLLNRRHGQEMVGEAKRDSSNSQKATENFQEEVKVMQDTFQNTQKKEQEQEQNTQEWMILNEKNPQEDKSKVENLESKPELQEILKATLHQEQSNPKLHDVDSGSNVSHADSGKNKLNENLPQTVNFKEAQEVAEAAGYLNGVDIINPWTSQLMRDWMCYHLAKRKMKTMNTDDDIEDGYFILLIIQMLGPDPVSNFRHRTDWKEPLRNPKDVEENQNLLRTWLKDHGQNVQGSFMQVVHDTVWKLVASGLNKNSIPKDGKEKIAWAKGAFDDLGIPYPYFGLEMEGKEDIVLLTASILKDRIHNPSSKAPSTTKVEYTLPAPQKYTTSLQLDKKIADEGVLRIFLSSTFRDMQKERDHFFRSAVPELKTFAKSKMLDLVFIDLRWGLTSEDSRDGWVIVRCFDSIKKCAYFVCFLGARYGWIPDPKKTELNRQERLEALRKSKPEATMRDVWVEWHSETNKRYPFIDKMPGLSVTEYEIQYAALIESPACSRVFFYFRDEAFAVDNADTEAEKKLMQPESKDAAILQNKLKDRIRSCYGVETYRGPEHFANLLGSQLKYAINIDFSSNQTREPEDQAHHQFMQHRLAGFEGRKELLLRIKKDIELQWSGRSDITVLAAESGIGKSSLMAAMVREMKSENRKNDVILYHFVGCTNISNYVESISIRFWKGVVALNGSLDMGFAKVTDAEYQKEGLHGLIQAIGRSAADQRFVLFIDAINQLQASQEAPVPHMLSWLPKKTPQNLAIVVSTIDTHISCENLIKSGLEVIPVTKLTLDEIRQGAGTYLARYDKKLSEEQLQMILDDADDTGHPLYLRLTLDEVRVFGVYEKLNEEMRILLSTNGVIELYNLIITRWETKFNKDGVLLVETAMKVLYVSRIGLSEGDLDNYVKDVVGIKFSLALWKSFFFTLLDSLFVRNGRYMYFHQLLVETTKMRFFGESNTLKETQKHYGTWLLGQYADITDSDEDTVAEICHQLLSGECYDALVEYLKKEFVVESMLGGRYRYEFFNCWRSIHAKGAANYKEIYSNIIKSTSRAGDALVEFFVEAYESSYLIANIPLRIAKRTGEVSKVVDYLALGRVHKSMKNWTDSLSYFHRCLEVKLHTTSSDESLALLYDEMGGVYLQQNRFVDAVSNFEKALSIRKSLFGEVDLRVALSHDQFGHCYMSENKFEEAQKSFNDALEIRAKLVGKDHPLMATSLVNSAYVDKAFQRFEYSLEKLGKAMAIWQVTLGRAHPSVALAQYQIALIYEMQLKFSECLEELYKARDILVQTLGENHPDTVEIYEKIGDAEHEVQNYTKSLQAYNSSLSVRKRTMGENHPSVAAAYENVGRTNFELGRRDQVGEFVSSALKIRRQTGTKTLIPTHQTGRIADLMSEQKAVFDAQQLYKELADRFFKNQSDHSWSGWALLQKINRLLFESKKHKEGLQFWKDMTRYFSDKLGPTNDRTLVSCYSAFTHQYELDNQTSLLKMTDIADFMRKNHNADWSNSDLDRDNVAGALLSIVYSSRKDKDKASTAGQAISYLNFAGYSLSGLDLSGVKLEKANLCRAVLDGTSFKGADLNGSRFNEAFLGDCVFDEANMKDVYFGPGSNQLLMENDGALCAAALRMSEECVYVAYGGSDKIIHVRDPSTGKELFTLEGHRSCITSLCSLVYQDEIPWIVSGSKDGHVFIWDISKRERIYTLSVHKEPICSLCVVRKDKEQHMVVSASEDGLVFIWNVESDSKYELQATHAEGNVKLCLFNGLDQKLYLATGDQQGRIQIFDPYANTFVYDLTPATESSSGGVRSICSAIGPNKAILLVVGHADGVLSVWNFQHGRKMMRLKGHIRSVEDVCSISGPHGECWLASGSEDGSVSIWDLESGLCVRTLKGHKQSVFNVFVINQNSHGVLLGSASQDQVIKLWDLESDVMIKANLGEMARVDSLCSVKGPRGELWLASGGEDKIVRVWEPLTGMQVKTITGIVGCIKCMCTAYGPKKENWLIIGGTDKRIIVWDLDNWKEVRRIKCSTPEVHSVRSLQRENLASEKILLASAGSDNAVRIWDLSTGNEEFQLDGHTGDVMSLCSVVLEDGRFCILSASQDKTIKIWDVGSRTLIRTLVGHTGAVRSVICHEIPKQRALVASGGDDKTVRIWDLSSGTTLSILDGYTGSIASVCMIQGVNEDLWFVAGCQDGQVCAKNMRSEWKACFSRRQTESVCGICRLEGQEGKHLFATSSADQKIYIWDLAEFSSQETGESSIMSAIVGDRAKDVFQGFAHRDEQIKKLQEESGVCGLVVRNILGHRTLEGGRISFQKVDDLSQYDKNILLSKGGISYDADFVSYCESGDYTEDQAQCMVKCYENGWGVEKDERKASEWSFKSNQVVSVTSENAREGLRVRRGRDWKWDDQDGGVGCLGTLVRPDSTGWWRVKWDKTGNANNYRTGADGKYDLEYASGSVSQESDASFNAGDQVELAAGYESVSDAKDGPLSQGEVGEVVRVDTSDDTVQVKSTDGRTWWYGFRAIKKTSKEPSASSSAAAVISVGGYVKLSDDYKQCDDASGGPLQPGDVGVVLQDDKSSKPYQVKSSTGKTWWYTKGALVAVSEKPSWIN